MIGQLVTWCQRSASSIGWSLPIYGQPPAASKDREAIGSKIL
jgi:hypothetical protein